MGLVHVYTGDGKGKTTAAFGLAMRALGHGIPVLVMQFLKGGGRLSGEAEFFRGAPGAELICFPDQRHPMFCTKGECDLERLKASINDGFRLARDKVINGRYGLVVLDEVNNCMKAGWLAPEDVLSLIADKPENVELVLTGRGAPGEVIAAADYVTEMRPVRHPADKGVTALDGVEY